MSKKPISKTNKLNKNKRVKAGYQLSKWAQACIAIAVLDVVVMASWLLMGLWLSRQSGDVVGETLVFGLLFGVIFVVAVALALINLIGIPIHIIKQRPRGNWLGVYILSLLISLVPFYLGASVLYSSYVRAPTLTKKFEQDQKDDLKYKYGQQRKEIRNGNVVSREITNEYAIELLKSCEIGVLYYTAQTSETDGKWGELSSTGIVLSTDGNSQFMLSIANRYVDELTSLVQEGRCMIVLWHDGQYWQKNFDNGSWNPILDPT